MDSFVRLVDYYDFINIMCVLAARVGIGELVDRVWHFDRWWRIAYYDRTIHLCVHAARVDIGVLVGQFWHFGR